MNEFSEYPSPLEGKEFNETGSPDPNQLTPRAKPEEWDFDNSTWLDDIDPIDLSDIPVFDSDAVLQEANGVEVASQGAEASEPSNDANTPFKGMDFSALDFDSADNAKENDKKPEAEAAQVAEEVASDNTDEAAKEKPGIKVKRTKVKTTAKKKAPAKKASAKKAPAKKSSAKKSTQAKKNPSKNLGKKAAAKSDPLKKAPAKNQPASSKSAQSTPTPASGRAVTSEDSVDRLDAMLEEARAKKAAREAREQDIAAERASKAPVVEKRPAVEAPKPEEPVAEEPKSNVIPLHPASPEAPVAAEPVQEPEIAAQEPAARVESTPEPDQTPTYLDREVEVPHGPPPPVKAPATPKTPKPQSYADMVDDGIDDNAWMPSVDPAASLDISGVGLDGKPMEIDGGNVPAIIESQITSLDAEIVDKLLSEGAIKDIFDARAEARKSGDPRDVIAATKAKFAEITGVEADEAEDIYKQFTGIYSANRIGRVLKKGAVLREELGGNAQVEPAAIDPAEVVEDDSVRTGRIGRLLANRRKQDSTTASSPVVAVPAFDPASIDVRPGDTISGAATFGGNTLDIVPSAEQVASTETGVAASQAAPVELNPLPLVAAPERATPVITMDTLDSFTAAKLMDFDEIDHLIDSIDTKRELAVAGDPETEQIIKEMVRSYYLNRTSIDIESPNYDGSMERFMAIIANPALSATDRQYALDDWYEELRQLPDTTNAYMPVYGPEAPNPEKSKKDFMHRARVAMAAVKDAPRYYMQKIFDRTGVEDNRRNRAIATGAVVLGTVAVGVLARQVIGGDLDISSIAVEGGETLSAPEGVDVTQEAGSLGAETTTGGDAIEASSRRTTTTLETTAGADGSESVAAGDVAGTEATESTTTTTEAEATTTTETTATTESSSDADQSIEASSRRDATTTTEAAAETTTETEVADAAETDESSDRIEASERREAAEAADATETEATDSSAAETNDDLSDDIAIYETTVEAGGDNAGATHIINEAFQQEIGVELSADDVHQLYLDSIKELGAEGVADLFTGDNVSFTDTPVDRWGTQTIIKPGEVGISERGFGILLEIYERTQDEQRRLLEESLQEAGVS